MKGKIKGSNAERELVEMFCNTGTWLSIRVAGSGVSRFPCPDVLASNGEKTLAIECKAISEPTKYLEKRQMDDLIEFSKKFKAEPWVAIKLKNKGWFFFNIEDLKRIDSGNFLITEEHINTKAKKFFELTENKRQSRL